MHFLCGGAPAVLLQLILKNAGDYLIHRVFESSLLRRMLWKIRTRKNWGQLLWLAEATERA